MNAPGQPATPDGPTLPLRCCLLSGGESRRMGRDKALLTHPEGGTWLERTLRLLATLQAPITVISRHPAHLALAEALAQELDRLRPPELPPGLRAAASCGQPRITVLAEPPPWEGPLRALQRLMEHHPGERLLLCPVDMPWLDAACLTALLAAADRETPAAAGSFIHLAHDGQRLQPLLGLYPAEPGQRASLSDAVERGERRLQRWLAERQCRVVPLDAAALRNINRPDPLMPDAWC